MIPKIISGNSFRGVLDYNMDEKKNHELIDSNMMGETPRELAKEFSYSRQKNQKIKNPVFHASLSFDKSDKVDNEKMKEISNKFLEKMGYKNTQYVVIKHNDTEHQHMHIVASRIQENGIKVKSHKEVDKAIKISRGLEKEFGLYEVNKIENGKIQENGISQKANVKDSRIKVKESVSKYFENNKTDKSIDSFVEYMQDNKLNVYFAKNSKGEIFGVNFKANGFTFKGSSIGKEFSWKNIDDKLNYDKNKDLNTVEFSNYLSLTNNTTSNFKSINKFYDHYSAFSPDMSENNEYEKTFHVLNKVGPNKLDNITKEWADENYTNNPIKTFEDLSKSVHEESFEKFSLEMEKVGERYNEFMNKNEAKELYEKVSSGEVSVKNFETTNQDIDSLSKKIPVDVYSDLGLSGKDVFEHKLDSLESRDERKEALSSEFKSVYGDEKERFSTNLKIYFHDLGQDDEQMKYNHDIQMKEFNKLEFNRTELNSLQFYNANFKERKESPLDFIRKQAEVTKSGVHAKGFGNYEYDADLKKIEENEIKLLKNNLRVFGKEKDVDVYNQLAEVDSLKFTSKELKSLQAYNIDFEKKDYKDSNPADLTNKQKSLNNFDRVEYMLSVAEKMNETKVAEITKADSDKLLRMMKDTGYSFQVPAMLNSFQKGVKNGDIDKDTDVISYIDDAINNRKNYDRASKEFEKRTGSKLTKEVVQERVKDYLLDDKKDKSLSSFVHYLNENDIKVKFNVAETGHVSGVSFKSGNFTFKASAISKNASWKNLSNDLGFKEEKDSATIHLSNHLANTKDFAKDFKSTDKFYKHLFKREKIDAKEFDFQKSFRVLNQVNHDKLKTFYKKWDKGDYATEPKAVLVKAAKELEERERKEFYEKINGINENIPGFFSKSDQKEIFQTYLSGEVSKIDLDKTIEAISINSQFIPKDISKTLGVTGRQYYEHKLSTFESHDLRKSEFSNEYKTNLEKQKKRLEDNLKKFGEQNKVDVSRSINEIKYLKINRFELGKLSQFNNEMEKGEFKDTPLNYVKKQAEITKSGKHEKGEVKPPIYLEEFKKKEELEKDRLKYNLHLFGKDNKIDVSSTIEKVDKLKFTDLELNKLSKANDEFDKKNWSSQIPIVLVDKQENFNKLDKFELVVNTTQNLNKEHKLGIKDEDVKTLLSRMKDTDFSYRVPMLVKEYSNKVNSGELGKEKNIVQYVDNNLNKGQGQRNKTISTPSFFQDLNKASQIAQESSGGRRIKRRPEEEEKEQKQDRGMEIS